MDGAFKIGGVLLLFFFGLLIAGIAIFPKNSTPLIVCLGIGAVGAFGTFFWMASRTFGDDSRGPGGFLAKAKARIRDDLLAGRVKHEMDNGSPALASSTPVIAAVTIALSEPADMDGIATVDVKVESGQFATERFRLTRYFFVRMRHFGPVVSAEVPVHRARQRYSDDDDRFPRRDEDYIAWDKAKVMPRAYSAEEAVLPRASDRELAQLPDEIVRLIKEAWAGLAMPEAADAGPGVAALPETGRARIEAVQPNPDGTYEVQLMVSPKARDTYRLAIALVVPPEAVGKMEQGRTLQVRFDPAAPEAIEIDWETN